jgi:hypothetical protein
MNIPESRNAKGEDHGKFAAEMLALSKLPGMRPFLTSTEIARQAKEKEREEQAEKERQEAEQLELQRRDALTARWFEDKMMILAPDLWLEFQVVKRKKVLSKAKWRLTAKAGTAAPEGYVPVPTTVVSIFHQGKLQVRERLVWEEPKPIPSRLVKL